MESVHDIYAAGSTARPLAVGDWVLLKDDEFYDALHHLVIIGPHVFAASVVEHGNWNKGVEVASIAWLSESEAKKILASDAHETWHRLTPAEAVAWMAEHLAGEEK